MADINKLFETFNDNITLTSAKSDDVRTGRDALREKIKKWFKDNDKLQPDFCWQGSFAMKTTINPLGDKEYDLDDGIYLNGHSDKEISGWPSTTTVHGWIKDAVDGHTLETPIDKNTCVRVVYAKGYHIDYPIYILENGVNARLAHKANGWIESDPKEFKNWFIGKVNSHGEQLRRIVKYLKAWKDFKDVSLKGIEITILVANNICIYEGRDEEALKRTLNQIIDRLEVSFECLKPVAPFENLFDGISQTKKNNIINALKFLKSKVELAINEDDQLKASEYMIEVFGSRFPKGTSNDGDKTNKVFVQTSAPGVLKHDGRSA